MEAKERRKVENALMAMGLSGINDPELFQVFGDLIDGYPGDKHEFFRDLLNECEPQKRSEMYQALAPRVRSFKPLSLSQYEAQIALRAGAMVSQGRMRVEGRRPDAIEIGGHKVKITPRERANCGWVALRCNGCDAVAKFVADTPVGAVIEARKAGWVKDVIDGHEYCVNCAEARAVEQKRYARA